ncbi:hypothetical protein BaRGS_00024304 [Batillaria attramentaria]|uniref:Uncharacterized protein n=1 Tax=Batillaria attramentaria TaxID=370345 RepID=A0ABD0KBC1_9CAEN
MEGFAELQQGKEIVPPARAPTSSGKYATCTCTDNDVTCRAGKDGISGPRNAIKEIKIHAPFTDKQQTDQLLKVSERLREPMMYSNSVSDVFWTDTVINDSKLGANYFQTDQNTAGGHSRALARLSPLT